MNAVTLFVNIILLIAFGICLVLVRRHYTKLLDVANKRAQKSQQLKSVFIDNISRITKEPSLCYTVDYKGRRVSENP